MPFWYHLPVPALSDPQPAIVRIDRWLLDDGAEVHAGTRIAVLEAQNSRYLVATNGDGVLLKKLFPAGAHIESTNPIAVIGADGENIPYGRPYSVAQRLAQPQSPRS
jgi:pyruvate/2-oxoglutarate dehydrogenase complex dihydrolipoamide acyltransferase (E2) component